MSLKQASNNTTNSLICSHYLSEPIMNLFTLSENNSYRSSGLVHFYCLVMVVQVIIVTFLLLV